MPDEKCPKCGAARDDQAVWSWRAVQPKGQPTDDMCIWGCGRSSLYPHEHTLKCLRRQLAQLDAERETLYSDLHELRDAMGCDGSDLPQLLAKWDAVQTELAALKAIVEKLRVIDKIDGYWRCRWCGQSSCDRDTIAHNACPVAAAIQHREAAETARQAACPDVAEKGAQSGFREPTA